MTLLQTIKYLLSLALMHANHNSTVITACYNKSFLVEIIFKARVDEIQPGEKKSWRNLSLPAVSLLGPCCTFLKGNAKHSRLGKHLKRQVGAIKVPIEDQSTAKMF